MALEALLSETKTALREGRYPNEASIEQSIVLPCLEELGWDKRNPHILWPEYKTNEGRADFALCHPPKKPVVFIEVKQPGTVDSGIRQVLKYAFDEGVPFVAVTDGGIWKFFLPAEGGTLEERCVCKLDLFQQPVEAVASALRRYLEWEHVVSGKALEYARGDLKSRRLREESLKAIPDAWRHLLETADQNLVELISKTAESLRGVRPFEDDVKEFLRRQAGIQKTEAPESEPPAPEGPEPGEGEPPTPRYTVTLFGEVVECRNATEAMVTVLRVLAERDPHLLERCYNDPRFKGTERCYIARKRAELYPPRSKHLQPRAEPLPGGWFVGTNIENSRKRKIIKLVCEVAGLKFGKDVVISF